MAARGGRVVERSTRGGRSYVDPTEAAPSVAASAAPAAPTAFFVSGARGGRGPAPGRITVPMTDDEKRQQALLLMSASPSLDTSAAPPAAAQRGGRRQAASEAAAAPAATPPAERGGRKAATEPPLEAAAAPAPQRGGRRNNTGEPSGTRGGRSQAATAAAEAPTEAPAARGGRGGRRATGQTAPVESKPENASSPTETTAQPRATKPAAASPEISNRNRKPKRDKAGEEASAAASPEAATFDASKVVVTFAPDTPPSRFRLHAVEHNRVKLRSEEVKIGGKVFLLQERSVPGQDDAVYEKHPAVWENVPRGHCVVSVKTGEGAYTPVGEMIGMRKFGYREAKYGNRSAVITAVAIEKENGECAHVAAFSHAGEKYWLAGSKHVTIMFRDGKQAKEDLKVFDAMPRSKMASRVAQMTLEILGRVSEANRARFHQALSENGWTANAEVIFADSQHIVDYEEINDLRFYAISGPGPSSEYGLCAIGPDQSRELLEACGLHAVKRLPRVKYGSAEYKAQIASIARRENSEGVVMYGEDATGKVVCMWKEKSYPYVMERIVREAIKGGKVGEELLKYAQFRLSKQDKELREFFTSWEQTRLPFLVKFAAWLKETSAFKGKDVWDVSSKWLTLQRECKALGDAKLDSIASKFSATTVATGNCAPILLCGPPGCGKSTLGRALFALLSRAKQRPRWINQDEAQSDRKKFLAALGKAAKDPTVTHLIVDKANLARANRKDYTELQIAPALTLLLNHPEGPDELAALCISRVCSRGGSHRSLRVTTKEEEAKTARIINDFVKTAEWPEDPTCVELDVTKPLLDLVRDAYEAVALSSPTPLPDIESLNPAECLDLAMRYEQCLARFGQGTQLFASVRVCEPEAVLALIAAAKLPKSLIVKTSGGLHVTIKYFGGEMDPIAFVQHAARVGEPVDIVLDDLVFDDKGAAITVHGDFQSSNAVAHITVANADKVPPVYSNELLSNQPSKVVKQRIPIKSTVKGVFAFQ